MTAADAPVLAAGTWRTNAELIADIARLGYLTDDGLTLDPTYGLGRFWPLWRPARLVRHDLDPAKAPDGAADFTALPYPDDTFDAVAFDPPYKLNGTSAHPSDEAYGVAGQAVRWQDRHALIRAGITEATRVLRPSGTLLVKCQDQVCSGQVRWQTREFADHAESLGHRLVDRLDITSYRAQPPGRRQIHARRNTSTLLVLRLETR